MGNIQKWVKLAFLAPFDVAREPVRLPERPEPDRVFVRSLMSLISPGTELAFYTGKHSGIADPDNKWAKYPFYPGYATIGEVTAVGDSVTGVLPGERVFVPSTHASVSQVRWGAHTYKVPERLATETALLAFMASISCNAIIQSSVRIGDVAVVLGMGLVGNLTAQLLGLRGAVTVGVDRVEGRLRQARQCGIRHTVRLTDAAELGQAVAELTGGAAPAVVVDATGIPAATAAALDLVKELGQVVVLGSPTDSLTIDLYRSIHFKGVRLIGAHGRFQGRDSLPDTAALINYVFRLAEQGALVTAPLLTHRLPASEAKEGYDALHEAKDRALGVILIWQGTP